MRPVCYQIPEYLQGNHIALSSWRGTEAVITAPTRNRLGALAPQGFESLPLRHIDYYLNSTGRWFTLSRLFQGNRYENTGEMAEWSKAHAWKVCIRQRIEGSNPSLSAKIKDPVIAGFEPSIIKSAVRQAAKRRRTPATPAAPKGRGLRPSNPSLPKVN